MNNLFVSNTIVIGIELIVVSFVCLALILSLRLFEKRIKAAATREQMSDRIASGIKIVRQTVSLMFVAMLLVIIGFNAWKIYQGIELQQYTIESLNTIPPDFWQTVLKNTAILIVVIFTARHLVRLIDKGLIKLRTAALNYKSIQSNDDSIKAFFRRFSSILGTVIGWLVVYGAAMLFGMADLIVGYLVIALKIYLVISVSLLIVNAVAAIVDSLDAVSKHYADAKGLMVFYNRLKHLVPLLRRTLEYIIYVAVATIVIAQLDFIAEFARYGPGIIQGIGVIFLSRVGIEIISLLIDRTYLHDDLSEEERQRNQTIFPIVKSVLSVLVYFLAVVIVMKGLGFDPIPLLAGAGLLGLVVGFGAQSLVNDVVSGFFIIFENTFWVGDFIEVKKASGVVETIGLRTTRIRSDDGELHILQNGKLGDVTNHSQEYTNAVVNVGVSHKSDLQQVYAVLRDLGKALNTEMDDVLKPTEVAGVDDFSGPEIVIRTVTRVRPGRHKPIQREIRKRIIEQFQEAGIVIPFENRFKFA
jgi:moderate conductance mechanosensitive channel